MKATQRATSVWLGAMVPRGRLKLRVEWGAHDLLADSMGTKAQVRSFLSGDRSSPCGYRCTRSRARRWSREATRMLCLNPDMVVRAHCTRLDCLASKSVKAPRPFFKASARLSVPGTFHAKG